MVYFEIILLAFALSIDAFIVSFSCGVVVSKHHRKNAFKVAGANGFAQFLMPILGWYGANTISDYVKAFDHWIIFFVFFIIGLKFIKDALDDDRDALNCPKTLTFRFILIMSFAASIDAFVAGISIYFLPVSIWFTAIVIGVITFINSFLGFQISRVFKKISTKYIEILGGAILITLGTKILIEHLLES